MNKGCGTCANYTDTCKKCVNSGTFSEYTPLGPVIKDSGERREFETGAVRDIQEGKGRCDLLPLDMVGRLLNWKDTSYADEIIYNISRYAETSEVTYIERAIKEACATFKWTIPHAMLEVSKHFEAGCQKYGERNWEKGIPEHCYIDSAIRHYLKWRDGRTDEPHDRAVIWNLLCLWWTHENITEVDDERMDV